MTETNAGAAASGAGEASAAGPVVRVVRGEPTAEELAALVTVLAARSAGGPGEPERPRPVSGWTDRSRYVTAPRVEFGVRGGWRASALPR